MENKLVKISLLTMVISIALVLIVMFVFAKPVFILALAVLYTENLQSILLLLSGVVIVVGAVYIAYRYLLYMINHFKSKKIKTIIMAIIPIVLLTILGIIYKKEETFSLVIGIPCIYIFTVIVIPIIIIGMILLRNIKTIKKVIASTIIVILAIGIYVINYPYLKLCAEELSSDIGQFVETKTETGRKVTHIRSYSAPPGTPFAHCFVNFVISMCTSLFVTLTFSIFFTAYMIVLWSLPPKMRPSDG